MKVSSNLPGGASSRLSINSGIESETTVNFQPLHNFFGPRIDELTGPDLTITWRP